MQRNILLLIVSSILLVSCSNSTKKHFGLIENMPDEYKVKRNKSLEVPPSYNPNNTKTVKSGSNNFSQSEKALLKNID